MNTLRREIGALGWILRTVTFGLVAAAVYKELQLPADKRTWHGRLFDFVPYDFRIPTPRKLMMPSGIRTRRTSSASSHSASAGRSTWGRWCPRCAG